MEIISTNNLSKRYKEKEVLNSINLKLERGKIYGLLGKNGAGKSTLIKILLGLKFQSEGEIEKKMSSISYLPEEICLYPHLSAYENLEVVSLLSQKKYTKKDLDIILEKVNLHMSKNKKVKTFSLGMKRRLQLAIALYLNTENELIILDEPTNGLDLMGMEWFKKEIINLKKQGKSILMSSHSIKELEDLITDYIILNNGEICKFGRWEKNSNNKGAIIELESDDIYIAEQVFKTLQISCTIIDTDKIEINRHFDYQYILKLLMQNNIVPKNIIIKNESLEEIFSIVK